MSVETGWMRRRGTDKQGEDEVTLITRLRHFGKTLNMSMLKKFFSVQCADQKDLFHGLAIWNDENYRKLQGTYPVISLAFANVKGVIILLDEYDTPMQEAYTNGFWDELVSFTRNMFNAAFKTNL